MGLSMNDMQGKDGREEVPFITQIQIFCSEIQTAVEHIQTIHSIF